MRPALLTLLLLGVVATARAQMCASCEGGTLDAESRLCLPASVEGLAAIPAPQRRDLKAQRNPVVAGYKAMRYGLAVTLSLYDRGQPEAAADDEEMGSVVREVLDAHKDARLEMGGATSLPLAGEPTEGQGAVVTWHEGLTGYASLLWLLPQGGRWVKVSATYIRPAEGAGEAAELAMTFVRKVMNAICRMR